MVPDRQLSRLLQLLSDRHLFTRLRRGSPTPVLETGPSADTPAQIVWLVPDEDSNATNSLFRRVRGDDRHRWLLVSLSGRRRHQFLGGYGARHAYMTLRNGKTRFHSARDFHRFRKVRGVCHGGEYHRSKSGAGVGRSRRAMEGVDLRLLYTEEDIELGAKMEVLHRDGIITGGFIGSLILLLKDVLGFSYSLHLVQAVGNLSTWDHAVLLLNQGQADMYAGRLMMSNTRNDLIDFSVPLVTELAGAAIDSRRTLTLTEFRVTQPLETAVWCALLATQLLAVFVLCLIARCRRHIRQTLDEPSNDCDPSFWALTALGISCQQGAVVRSDSATSYRLAISSLYLVSLFVLACYSGNLLAEMTLARRVMPFDSLQEALEQGWQFTDSEITLAIRERIIQPLMGRDINQLPMVAAGPLQGRNIQLTTSYMAELHHNCTDLGRDDHCPVCLWPGSLLRVPYPLSFKRNFPYLRLFNYLLPQLLDQGIVSRELQRWRSRRTEDMLCPVGAVAPLQKKPLTISNLKNVVAIVGFGLLGSGVALLCERLRSRLWGCFFSRQGHTAWVRYVSQEEDLRVVKQVTAVSKEVGTVNASAGNASVCDASAFGGRIIKRM